MNNELVLSLFELPCDIQLYYGTTVNSLKRWSTEYFKSIAPNFFLQITPGFCVYVFSICSIVLLDVLFVLAIFLFTLLASVFVTSVH